MLYLAQNIKELRQRAGFSLEKESELIGVSRQSLTNWESGITKPSIEKIIELAKLFDLSLEELVSYPVKINTRISQNYFANHFIERVKINKNNDIHFPKSVIEAFSLKPGDQLILLADKNKGMIFLK